jgi:phosphoethanolamine N-methyltransferase
MAGNIEYDNAMRTMLDLIWGEGYMAPGGEGNIANLVRGLEVRDKRILDVGSGQGSPACFLAESYGAFVVGIDIEPKLIEISEARAQERGVEERTQFILVEPGPMKFPDASFDFAISSGGLTQIEEKTVALKEALRVLKPGGIFSCYEWMKCEGEYSEEMLYFFKMEGITYALETPDGICDLLREVGFSDVSVEDRSSWYRQRVREESERIESELYPRMLELMGEDATNHFVENWRALKAVCEKGDLLQVYSRGQKPA